MQRILVVEDDNFVRENLNELLSLSGFQSYTAVDGEDALGKARTFMPDLVISDIMMPKKDGYEFYKSFNEIYGIYNIPFIFLTAKSEAFDIRKGMNLGADDYITKPFKAQALLDTINARLAKSKNQKQLFEKFTTNIALYVPHELRTPLISILGVSQLIIEEYDNLSKQEILSFAEQIHLSGERLHKRIEKFLVLAEIELMILDRNYLGLVNFSSLNIIEDIVSSICYLEHININMPELPQGTIKMSKHFLHIIINEILENAIKFKDKDSLIKIQYKIDDDNFYFIVINSSIENIPNMIEHQIVDLMQFDREQKQQRGNGLGLSIVKRIAVLHELNFNIFKNPDNEITATIIFPLSHN